MRERVRVRVFQGGRLASAVPSPLPSPRGRGKRRKRAGQQAEVVTGAHRGAPTQNDAMRVVAFGKGEGYGQDRRAGRSAVTGRDRSQWVQERSPAAAVRLAA